MKKILIVIPVIVIAAVLIVGFSLNSIIKGGVETVGPRITGTDVRLSNADISLLSGKGQLEGLFVGNPQGFNSESAFKLNEVRLALNVQSVFSDIIVVDEIYIDAPDITYEKSGKGDNIQALLSNIKKVAGGSGEGAPEGKSVDKEGEGKKIQINNFIFKNGKVNMAITALQGQGLTVDLPDIHLKDIGKDEGGTTFADAMKQVFAVLNKNILTSVTGSLPDVEKIAEGAVKEAEKTVEKTLGGSVDQLKGIFGK